MAVARRVRRLVNPSRKRGRRCNASAGRRKHRRRLTAAQIAAGFGGKRRQAAVKAARKRKRRAVNPHHKRRAATRKARTRVVYRTKVKYRTRTRTVRVNPKRRKSHRRARRTSNPAGLLVTYGPALANPTRRRKTVAKRRRKSNPRPHRRHRRRSNPVRVVYRARRRNTHRRRHSVRRRNPIGYGHGAIATAKAVAAGLVGVTITKTVPGFLPASMTSSPIMRVGVSAVIAWGAGLLATKMLGQEVGHAVTFGGFMQAGSVALNAFLPSIGGVIGLQGLTPSNDILLPYNMFAGRAGNIPQPGMYRPSGFAPAFAN